MKRFGGAEAPKPEDFELTTRLEDGGTKVHKFSLIPQLHAGNVVALMDALQKAPEEAAGRISTLVARVLNDRDGTPARWQPPTLDDLVAADADREKIKPRDITWTGPDGEPYTLADDAAIAKFQDPANGSSRRRWRVLMDPDNEHEGVMLNDLMDIAEWVIGLASDRPTQARASSTSTRKPRR